MRRASRALAPSSSHKGMFDPQGEASLIGELRDCLAGRTVILITHRPASLALADRVVKLEGGVISTM